MPESLLLLAKDLGVLVFLKKDFFDFVEESEEGCLALSFLRRRGEEVFFVFLRVVMFETSEGGMTRAFRTGRGMFSTGQ